MFKGRRHLQHKKFLGRSISRIPVFTITNTLDIVSLTQFRLGLFMGAYRWEDQNNPLPKIFHTYPTMMKLFTVISYLKKIKKKHISHVKHHLNFAYISIFLPEISNFCYVKKYQYIFYFTIQFLILLTFSEF